LTKSAVTSSQCPMPLQNGAILLYVTVYEYFHLRQISKQLGCYSLKMQKSSENLSSVEFSEASKIEKIPNCVEITTPCRYRMEPYYSMLRCKNIFI